MSQQTATVTSDPSLSDLVDHLTRFDGPPDQFLMHMLAVQCHVGSADGGTILRVRADKEPEVLAVFPAPREGQTAPVWLAQSVASVSRVAASTSSTVVPIQGTEELYDQTPKQNVIMIPLRGDEGIRGVAAFFLQASDPIIIDESKQRLELTVSLLSLYEMRLTLQRRQTDMQRLRQGLEILSAINDQNRFRAAAMGLCNEVASVWEAERVTLGFLKGRYVRTVAMSHTEKLTRKMKVVLDIEAAMEECFDQDVEVIHPAGADSMYVSRATGNLSREHGGANVCSLPMRQSQDTVGVLTVERPADKPFDNEAIESLRLVCELCTARLVDLWEHDKWIGAKTADMGRKGLRTLLGAEYTWVKVAAVLVFAAIIFFSVARGNDYADGSFVVEAIEKKVVPAPFDAYLYEVHVERGDRVIADLELAGASAFVGALDEGSFPDALRAQLESSGIALSRDARVRTVHEAARWSVGDHDRSVVLFVEDDTVRASSLLATLDTGELRLQLGKSTAELVRFKKQEALAKGRFNQGEAQVAAAQAEGVQAEIDLLEFRIRRSLITAPMPGVVITGDLKKEQGVPVEPGQVLFEIAPLDAMRAEVSIPEDRIVDLSRDQAAVLTTGDVPADGQLGGDASFTLELTAAGSAETQTFDVSLPVQGEGGTSDNGSLKNLVDDLNAALAKTADEEGPLIVADRKDGRLTLSTRQKGRHIGLVIHLDESGPAGKLGLFDGQQGRHWRGDLTAVSQPGLHFPIEVERISPVAEMVNQRNVYRVRTRFVRGEELAGAESWLTPGLEGVARIKVGRAHYAWMWTRELVDWVRMKLWI
ncbi:MAG: hypothetical protein CMJ18_28295 [Phycisphaeraceae bacterium]|nr:hypothetical protein [Phycisphaeraceae bacterium]